MYICIYIYIFIYLLTYLFMDIYIYIYTTVMEVGPQNHVRALVFRCGTGGPCWRPEPHRQCTGPQSRREPPELVKTGLNQFFGLWFRV